jgi:hypothetical protein
MGKHVNEDSVPDWEFASKTLMARIAELEHEAATSRYVDIDTFVEQHSSALHAYLRAQYSYSPPDRKMHPHDLASAVATFGDAFWAIYDNIDFSK